MTTENLIILSEKLEKHFNTTIDLTKDYAIPYLRDLSSRFLLFNFIIGILVVFLGSLLIVMYVKLWSNIKKNKKQGNETFFTDKHGYFTDAGAVSLMLLVIIMTIVVSFAIFESIPTIFEILIIPEVFILKNIM